MTSKIEDGNLRTAIRMLSSDEQLAPLGPSIKVCHAPGGGRGSEKGVTVCDRGRGVKIM